ncbi:MAG: urease accessory protein UreD [Methylophaga sp.]|nr:urease accessory protein UreD [Methylophaga sp.]
MKLAPLQSIQPDVLSGWLAQLSLAFERRHERTILVRRQHYGPMVIQKILHPQTDDAAHGVIVHPPGGIAGGDQLELHIDLASKAQVLLTTPGATKWYKSAGRLASQQVDIRLAADSQLEWLPQENIVFNGAEVSLRTDVSLAENAKLATWEIISLGRSASGENWQEGRLRQNLTISRQHRLIWSESAVIHAESKVLAAKAGLKGNRVFGSFIVAAGQMPAATLEKCRAVNADGGSFGVSALPEIFVARYMGGCPQQARQYFEQLWACLRPWYGAAQVVRPRIWAT